MPGHGKASHPTGFSPPPPLGELSCGRGWVSGTPSTGSKVPRLEVSSFLALSFTATLIWSGGPGSPSKRRAEPGGAGKEGKETEGRDPSLSSLRPLLPRRRRSPNWRGTGFSTAFCLHNPLAPRLLRDAAVESGGAKPHSRVRCRGWRMQRRPI